MLDHEVDLLGWGGGSGDDQVSFVFPVLIIDQDDHPPLFDFFNQLQGLAFKQDLDKDLLKFQADLADQYSSGWNDFFNVVGQGIGLYASGGLSGVGALFGGGGGNAGSGAPWTSPFHP